MNNKPHEISANEWHEIMEVDEVREGWGLDEDTTPQEFASSIYGSRFDFVSGGPGYSGDLFVLQGDCDGSPPMVLVRNRSTKDQFHPNGQLQVIHN